MPRWEFARVYMARIEFTNRTRRSRPLADTPGYLDAMQELGDMGFSLVAAHTQPHLEWEEDLSTGERVLVTHDRPVVWFQRELQEGE
jgi:hypothetical protein